MPGPSLSFLISDLRSVRISQGPGPGLGLAFGNQQTQAVCYAGCFFFLNHGRQEARLASSNSLTSTQKEVFSISEI